MLFVMCCIICRVFKITCLFYAITKIQCPTCYMGRALIALLMGDIQQYFMYNIMAVPVAFVFIFELFSGLCGKYKNMIHIFAVIVLSINMLYYLARMNFIF